MEGEWKCVIWFDNPGSRCVFLSISLTSPPSTHNKMKPQWLLAAHRVSAKLCVCVCVWFRLKERKRHYQEAHSGELPFLPTGTTANPLLLSSPPLLPSRPSFQTQQPCRQSLFIPSPRSSSSLLTLSLLSSIHHQSGASALSPALTSPVQI